MKKILLIGVACHGYLGTTLAHLVEESDVVVIKDGDDINSTSLRSMKFEAPKLIELTPLPEEYKSGQELRRERRKNKK